MENLKNLIVNFSLRKEVFFVVIGSIIGAFTMHLPRIFSDLIGNSSYIVTLLVSAKVVNSSDPLVGFLLHLFVATSIGIVTGVLLHKAIKFNLSKVTNGFLFGIVGGIVVFAVFAIPVSQLLLSPNMIDVLSESNPTMSVVDAVRIVEESFFDQMLISLLMHLIWGSTLGIISSFFTRKFGANYLCHTCNVEFSKFTTWEHHQKYVHEISTPEMKRIVIVGGGYAGIGVLNKIQKKFQDDVNVSISLVSESNFFLHTPMLPEMATGTIEPRHIATPIRKFCKRARFYQAKVTSIELESKQVTIQRLDNSKQNVLFYDYLVLASGMKTNFFGNASVEKNSLTIKTLDDAIQLRNHILGVLENADQETDDIARQTLTTFVVVGGGFSGVETVGEITDFVRDSVRKYYRNIPSEDVKIILIASTNVILPEIGNLGNYARETLEKSGVTIYTNTRLQDYTQSDVIFDNGKKIKASTLVWVGGNMVDEVISNLNAEHHKSGRLVVDSYLQLVNHTDVYALGDCAYSVDPRNDIPYPPTAQHAIRQADTVTKNLANNIEGNEPQSEFIYDTKGSMAKIGKRDGVALLLGREFRGFSAWIIWKQYYLSTLPTTEKKIRVGVDWLIDLFFPRDITQFSNFMKRKVV